MGFFGALNMKTGSLLTEEAPNFNSGTFGDFIRYFLQSTQGKNIPCPRQCQMAEGKRFERLVRVQSTPTDTNLPSVTFTRTQSSGTGLAND